MRRSDESELLADLLTDEAFREESLARTIQRARGKRRLRHAQVAAVGLAVLLASAMLSLKRNPVTAPTTSRDEKAAFELVNTRPLRPGILVSSAKSSAIVVTTKPGSITEIADEELLAVVPGETKLLVWHAPGRAELVVLDAEEPQ